jgi:hypothetical protein
MALKNKTRKYTGNIKKLREMQYMLCKECSVEEVLVSSDVGAVTCGRCVQKMLIAPPSTEKKAAGDKFPRGWHFKARYVHTDGKVYKRGKLTDETE